MRCEPQIIATVNFNHATATRVRRYVDGGATLLRLNGAFVTPGSVPAAVRLLRSASAGRARLMLDLPGYKLRLQHLAAPLRFARRTPFALQRSWLNYPDAFDLFEPGTALRLSDGRIVLTIEDRDGDAVMCRASRPGLVTPGKGIHLERGSYRPSAGVLSQLDCDLVRAAVAAEIECVGLSFVNGAEDIVHVQQLCRDRSTQVVPKIESKESVKRIGEIVELASEVIIDRGDLAGEIGLENVWRAQREIIGACKRSGVRVYAATQVLSSMVHQPLPSIAEIDSLCSLIHEGIDGVQLSEETTVGRHATAAIQTARLVFEQALRRSSALRLAV